MRTYRHIRMQKLEYTIFGGASCDIPEGENGAEMML